MACKGSIQSTENKAYYLKYISFLNDGANIALLEKLKQSVPNGDISAHVTNNKHKLIVLKKQRVISNPQFDLLFPTSGQPDPSNFDITLLTCLLRSTCLTANSSVWDPRTPPSASDLSVEADVARLRNLRNKYIGHPKNRELTKADFEAVFSDTEKVMLRLGSTVPDFKTYINEYKTKTIDPLREAELLKEFHTCIDEVKQKQEDMQQQLTTMAKNQKRTTISVEDVRQTLLSLYERRFKQISVFPEEKVDVEDLYVDQELSYIKQCGKSGTKEKNDQEKKTINTVKEIFYKDGKICENILISSEPGLGKSTFCKRLVRLWYQGQTLCETDRTEDQSAMRAFEILFYIDLKELKEDDIPPDVPSFDEIAPTIYKLLDLKGECQEDDIRALLKKPSTLVIMDSLDELGTTRVPHRGLHNKCCIVITSRPWKIEALRSHITDINQHIEIVGLAQNSPEYLADKVITLLNNGSSPTKTVIEFMRDIETNKLRHFLNNPLLLIKMVCIWLNGESVGTSQFKIYSQLMHYQICTAVETKPLLKDVDMGSRSERNLSFCSKLDPCPCRKYGMLMRKVAQLAYHTLFNKDGQMCLVFDHKQFEIYELSTKEIELCSKIGILTQRKLFDKDPFKKKKTVSFPHKTNQEYFAAIFLSGEGQQSDLDHIRSVVSDLDRALELDKVLLFCSEINTAVAAQLSHLISEIADKNPSVQEYRHSCDRSRYRAPHADLIEKIQNIIIPATQQNTQLFLSDIIIKNDEGPQWRRFEKQNRKHFVHYLDLTIIKSLGISAHATDELLQSLKLCNHLQTLVLCDSGIKVKDIHEMVVRNKATLITLYLAGEEYGGSKPLDILTLGAQWRDMLTVKWRNMLTVNLSSLGLNNVKLSHKQCQDLSTFVATTNNLRQVKLERISCETHGYWWRGKCFMLDFRRNINLHTVKLTDLPVTDVHLQTDSLRSCEIDLPGVTAQTSIFTALKDASELQELTCWYINDTSSVFLFLDILPNFNNLQRIKLWHVEFGDVHNVCLSATMEKLEHVGLSLCTITSAGLRCLINSLPNHNVEVALYRVTVTDDEKIFQDIRDSPNTNITKDHGVEKIGDWWTAWEFYFDNNNTRPGQA